LEALARHRIGIVLGFGVVVRVAQYLADRSFWLDEGSLAECIRRIGSAGLLAPLSNSQLAPTGFLAVAWSAVRVFGASKLAFRLFPLVCGLASLFLFHRLAARCLRPPAALIALALFAVSDDLIYYSSELKPYQTDVTAAVLCELLAVGIVEHPAAAWRWIALALGGAVLVWLSFPAVFVLAGVGTVLLVEAIISRQWPRVLALAASCLIWMASFAGVYAIARLHLGGSEGMWVFWGFAFPPRSIASIWDATWAIRRSLYLFVNPLSTATPLGPTISALPSLGFFLVGCVTLWRRSHRLFGMLMAPWLFTLAAAYLRLYPFHGRLVLFLVPMLMLLIAEGAGWVGERAGNRACWATVLGVLLLFPTLQDLYYLVEPRPTASANPHGDQRPASLDPERFPF
jgi:hypothetical protein